MTVKNDGEGRRWVEMEFLVPGSPEQVWDAIATGPGMSAWFTPTTVDEKLGGAIEFDFGGGPGPATIASAAAEHPADLVRAWSDPATSRPD
ncbi:hypothetical protein [Mycolicibacterium vaccae]|uniref:hypothetical protein n=1 Tax=Mycolicibacterium vaccae TaxID=1810 RepID=UPI003D07B012